MVTLPLMYDRDVLFETASLSESFVTMRTFVVTLTLMYGRDVGSETASLSES